MAGQKRKENAGESVFPEVLYPGNMQAMAACFVYGQLPKHSSGPNVSPRVSVKTLRASGGSLQCTIVYHFVYDPIVLGANWDTLPLVWLLYECKQKGVRWHFYLKAQAGMTAADSNAQWPVLIEGGTHILWRPNKIARSSGLLRVHQNGTVVPNDPR